MRGAWGPVAICSLCLVACAGAVDSPLPPVPSSTGRVAAFAGTTVELLTDGAQAAQRMVALIASARIAVDVEIYEFDRGDLGDALIAARGRGVAVQVIEDPTVSVNPATAMRLREAGANVLLFPVQPRQIDHVKLLVVDSKAAIFGGMNWGSGSWRNHDFDVAVTGPIVSHLTAIFASDVVRSGGRAELKPAPPDPVGLAVAATYPSAGIRPLVLDSVYRARHELFIEMYVMTDSGVISALSAAARRGVGVFILFDPNQDLNQLAAARLRDAGVKVRFYRTRGEKLHAKAMVVDGEVLVVGSANWTSSGFLHNHELDVVIDSRAIAARALARMEADWRASGN